jgi:hypothetical protein
MSDISDAIKRAKGRRRSVACLTNEWLVSLSDEDRTELSEFAIAHVASAFNIAVDHGFEYGRSTWTQHFKNQCPCGRERHAAE